MTCQSCQSVAVFRTDAVRGWRRPTRMLLVLLGGVLTASGLVGCVGWDANDGANWGARKDRLNDPPMESNVIAVRKFFSAVPWLIFNNDGSGRVDGVKITVYLEGPRGPKGVFGNGTIVVQMYRVDPGPAGRDETTLVQEWSLPPEKAYPWRIKKESGMGWGYSLRLPWDKDAGVDGRQVAIVVRYIRADGRELSSSPQVLKVPIPSSSRMNLGGS